SMPGQWDVGRTLALSALLRLLQGAGRGCTVPFLTLLLRVLALPTPLVGAVAGARLLAAALGAHLCSCCPRGRRLLLAGSLLGSAGVGLLLTFIPPASNVGLWFCKTRDQGTTTTLPYGGIGTHSAVGLSAATNGYSDGPSSWTASMEAAKWETREVPAPYRPLLNGLIPSFHGLEEATSSPGSAAKDLADNTEESFSATGSNDLSLFKTTLPTGGDAYVSGNLSDHQKDTQDVRFKVVKKFFQDKENQVFLMVLGAVVLWELLASSLEWIVDKSLYEYLDFVDATERYGKLWIWSYVGMSVGACSIAIIVDQLDCFSSSTVTLLAVHFYGYTLLTMLSLFVSVFYPIHVPKRTDRVNKTTKALALLWRDGRAILYAVTLILTGAAGSGVQNFLFWQMQDHGSSELYMGLSVAVGLLTEILLFFFKGKFLRTFSSSKIVAVSLSLLAAQLLCYSFLWTVWSVLLIQIFSAFGSSALWWVVNTRVDDIATPGTETSLHAVLQSLCYGGGASLGSFAGGFVVKHFGLAVLYRASCICLVLWLFLFLILQAKLPQQKKINYSRLLAVDSSDVSDSDEENERDWLVKAMKDESFN
ncbi:MF6LB protein, partial [Ceuthmochares aereus]|nr:MF6LB protein [Ceuthmochares aereus]